MRQLAVLTACLLLFGCTSWDRLHRNSPLTTTKQEGDRVNLWPLAYKSGTALAVLWPLYDQDDQGFALRPLVARDGTSWEVLPPFCYFDTKTGDWFAMPAYSFGESYGVFPIYNRGWLNNVGPVWWDEDEAGNIAKGGLFPVVHLGPEFNFAGPAWWNKDPDGSVASGGLFPIAYFSRGFNHTGLVFWSKDNEGEVASGGLFPITYFGSGFKYVGPAYWNKDASGDVSNGGLFPLAYFGPSFNYAGLAYWSRDDAGDVDAGGVFPIANFSEGFSNVGTVVWGHHPDGRMKYFAALPLVGYGSDAKGAGMFITPLGGAGWNAEGEATFVNILGPLYQHNKVGDGYFTSVTPFFTKYTDPRTNRWDVWPLVGHRERKDANGNPEWFETNGLAGLIKHEGFDKTERMRVLPLFSYRSADGGNPDVSDWLSLFSYKDKGDDGSSMHVVNPFVFDYEREKERCSWDSLFGAISYESEGENSEFDLFYYLYRQKTVGTETHRDIFPFITWDSGEERSGFSFLWRFLDWERKDGKVGGHVFFIPWGET